MTDLSIASDTKELDDHQGDQQWYDPGGIIDVLYVCPEMDDLSHVSLESSMARTVLTLQAAEISKGRTVSHWMPYSHPQANPHEGSMNLQMYMVKAPITSS